MATVAEILSVAGKMSGLRADAAESDLAMAMLNRTYQRACLDCELTGADVTYTTTSTGSALAASAIAGTAVMRVQHLRLNTSGSPIQLNQVSRQELQDYRAVDDSVGTPVMYSVSMVGGVVTVDFHPTYSSGDIIKMSYLATPPTLTTATTAISYLPEMFHHDILTNSVVAAMLERDGKDERAMQYHARCLEGLTRLEEYLGQMGGNANRAYVAPTQSRSYWPDARRR